MVQKIAVSPVSEPTPTAPRRFAYRVAPNLILSFRYALSGLQYAFLTQRNFRLHTLIGTLALSMGVSLHLPMVELAVISLTVALVLGLELLNTAVEAVVDLTVGRTYHELAKVAKDCAAGAVLAAACGSLLIALFLLLPPLWQNLTGYLFYR